MAIIEGDYFTEENYLALKKDYMQSDLTVKEILEKYDITNGYFSKHLRPRITKETGFRRKSNFINKNRKYAKYYIAFKNYWKIVKFIDGKLHYFGRYESKSDAKRAVDELKKCNWDKSQLSEICERLGV